MFTEVVIAGLSYALASTPVSSLVVGSITLSPNQPAVTLSVTHLSLGSDAFVVGSSNVALAGNSAIGSGRATMFDAHPVQAVPSSEGVVLVDGRRITTGVDPSSVFAAPVALNTNGDQVLGSSTNSIPYSYQKISLPTGPTSIDEQSSVPT